MEQNKILSIIIPTYNMEKYLRKCLDSLIVSEENMQRLEVLVVNDGSKDSSSSIGHEYEAKYQQTFRVIDKENGNYGSCINRGLKEATGKYVKVLDADDYFDPSVLGQYLDFLFEQEVDMVISDFNVVDENGVCLSEFTFNLPMNKPFSLQDIPDEMNTLLLHHSITYKRDVFERFAYKQTEGISYTDDEWIFKPTMWVDKVVYFPKTLYLYLRGREGQTFDSKVIERTLEQRVKVIKEMLSFYKANIGKCRQENVSFVNEKMARRSFAIYYLFLIRFHTSENTKKIKEFDLYLKSISPKMHDKINVLTNRLGWRYVKHWRGLHYSDYAPMLLALRFHEFIKRKTGKYNIVVDRIPDKLKRRDV